MMYALIEHDNPMKKTLRIYTENCRGEQRRDAVVFAADCHHVHHVVRTNDIM